MLNKMNKEQIHTINAMAKVDFEKAKAMLEGINLVLGTEYDFLNKRVTYFDDTSSVAKKFATAHDAWANAEDC